MRKQITLFALLCVFVCMQSFAQDRTLTGKVTSSQDNLGIPGASVVVVGTTIGTTTDIDGNYKLNVPANAKQLKFSGVGLKSKILDIGAANSLDLVMDNDVMKLDEVVVTALGISKDKKSLGYSVQSVGGDALTEGAQGNVLQAISGKVAGVQITTSSGAPGASTNIRLRGSNSILGDNQPLMIVDGVQIDNSTSYTGNPDDGSNNLLYGVGYSNRAIDLNPDDIESISVLKGGAATALYGINAANGALVITTKKGSKPSIGEKINITYNTSLGWDQVNRFVKTQQKYGQGSRWDNMGTSDFADDVYSDNPIYYGSGSTAFYKRFSWGPNVNDLAYDGDASFPWSSNGDIVLKSDPTAKGAVNVYDQNDFFQTGTTWNNSLSFSGGSDISTYRVSLGQLKQKGVVPLSDFKRINVGIAGQTAVSKKIRVSGSANYSKSGGSRTQQGSNTSGLMLGLLRTPVTFDNSNGITDPEDPAAFVFKDGRPRTYRGFGGYDNPYWTINRNPFKDNVDRLIGNVQADVNLLKWLTGTYRIGGDVYSDTRDQAFDIYSATASAGRVTKDVYTYSQINSYLLLTASHKLMKNLNGSLSVGNEVLSRNIDETYVQGDGLTVPTFFNLANAQSVGAQNIGTKYRTYSLFFDAKIDYNYFLYLEVTGRNDWSSTLPEDKRSFFYPSASLGFVFTDAFGMSENKILPFGKIRASWAQIGKDAPVYSLSSYFSKQAFADGWTSGISYPFDGTAGFTSYDVYGNGQLKPERQDEFEIGADLRFLKNRIGLDFTYYSRTNKDVIVPVSIAASTGYLQAVLNSGEISNKGIEISLNIDVLKNKNYSWNLTLNWSTNKSEVVTLAPGLENLSLGGFEGSDIRAVEGEPYGVIWGYEYQRDGSGNLILDDNGSPNKSDPDYNPLYATPIAGTKSGKIGDPNPDWLMGIANTFSYKGISLYALIDIKQGGDIWNGTKGALTYFGTSELTENRGEMKTFEGNMGHLDGNGNIVHYDGGGDEVAGAGSSNTTPAELGEYWYTTEGGGFGTTAKQFVEDGSYIKLREVALSYDLTRSLIKNKKIIKGVELGVFARNLIMSTKYDGVDPETSLTGAGNSQGMDYFNMPGAKTYGVNLKVNF